jgi:segregation and condensation protein B
MSKAKMQTEDMTSENMMDETEARSAQELEQEEAVAEEAGAAVQDDDAQDAVDAEVSQGEDADPDAPQSGEDEEPQEELIMTLDDVRLVEAMLFASASALTEGQIAERFPPARVKLIPDALEHLREHYANRGVNLVQREKRWALRTSTDLGDQLRLEREQPKKFTKAAMETMAVVAYHQPVTRAEIENSRGVATSPGALDALMEAGWIKPGKRREVPGRPVTWLSTQAFLDHFGLEKLGDLPGMEELKAAGLLDKRPAIEAMPTADLFGDDENKAVEGEDPQEVTDEDLIGKSGLEDEEMDEDAAADAYDNEDTVASEASSGGDDDEDEGEDEDYGDDEDADDEDADDDDSDESDEEESDEDDEDYGDDEDADDDGGDEDLDDEDGDEDYDDEDEDGDEDDDDDDDEDDDR